MPFLGEIKMFGGNFAPRGWALCDGQLLAINQATALFSLLGTTFGGDGRTTFGLPDLRGRMAVHPGSGPGLSHHSLGEKGGTETVTLTPHQLPSHNHQLTPRKAVGSAEGARPGPEGARRVENWQGDGDGVALTSNTGGSQPHNNMPPFMCVNYIICMEGTFPSRS